LCFEVPICRCRKEKNNPFLQNTIFRIMNGMEEEGICKWKLRICRDIGTLSGNHGFSSNKFLY
jgi:hypothetical protein